VLGWLRQHRPQLLLKTNTSQDADDCRQQIIDGGGGNVEVSDLNGAPPTLTSVCRDGDSFAYELWHYSDGQLAACEALVCSNCSWTLADANGTCP
jgi:hypothetical protein